MTLFISVLVLWLISLCLHEYAHARVAFAGGDTSVVEKGYLSLNPLRYLHPVTSLVIPVIILIIGGIPLPGGAVYIDVSRLRSKHWDAAVSIAGPLATLACCILAGLPFALGLIDPDGQAGRTLALFALFSALAFILNMLPIPGLDGFGVISPYLPRDLVHTLLGFSNILIIGLILVLWNQPEAMNQVWRGSLWITDVLAIPRRSIGDAYRIFHQAIR